MKYTFFLNKHHLKFYMIIRFRYIFSTFLLLLHSKPSLYYTLTILFIQKEICSHSLENLTKFIEKQEKRWKFNFKLAERKPKLLTSTTKDLNVCVLARWRNVRNTKVLKLSIMRNNTDKEKIHVNKISHAQTKCWYQRILLNCSIVSLLSYKISP